MEEDDDFGELYTDVLLPFSTHSATLPLPPSNSKTAPFQIRRPIDLNTVGNPDDDTLFEPSNSNSNLINNKDNNHDSQGLVFEGNINGLAGGEGQSGELNLGIRVLDEDIDDQDEMLVEKDGNLVKKNRIFSNLGISFLELNKKRLGESSFMDEDVNIDVVVEERDDKDGILVEKDEQNILFSDLGGKRRNLEILGGREGSLMIPCLSPMNGVSGGDLNFNEESESESEDDLQIVLNNDNQVGVMGMNGLGGMGDDEEEDGDPLVILARHDSLGNNPMMENQEWGEDAGAGIDGEKKELGDGTKGNGGVAVLPKVPYGNNAFHQPFHSQFKYVRPGVAPVAGPVPPGPGLTNGQVYPPIVGHVPGRGRGDWRPSGIKGGPIMQKGFHPGYGAPVWGSNSLGRGLDFTLPSHKTIFEVDIDSFEDKQWRLPGIDMSDFFNFGLNEEGWKEYCKQLEQRRLETTMQSRIRTYESGRAEQDYDPDLPPELAAASGVQGISSENITLVTTDPGHDLSNHARPPLPSGRPIQAETNFTDRLPSIDARQSRMRDSDSIIEINCRGSTDEGPTDADMVDPLDEQISDEVQDISDGHTEKETRKGHTIPLSSSKSSVQCLLGSREVTPQYSGQNSPVAEERRIKGRTCDRSPRKATSESTREKLSADDQNEKSYESVDFKHGRLSLSPQSVGDVMEQDVENQLCIPNEPVSVENSPESERETLDLEITSQDDMVGEESLLHSSKKQKSSSKVELFHETDEIGDSIAASSEDNKSGFRNSKGLEKSHEAIDEVCQGEGYAHMSKMKRSIDRDYNMMRRKGYNERNDAGRRHTLAKGEESYAHKGCETNYANRMYAITNGVDPLRESDNNERDLHKSDDNLRIRRTRVEDTRLRDQVDEIGSTHRNKVRESERSDKDEHSQLREHLDIGSRRCNPGRVTGSKRNRDDGIKRRDGSIDSLHNKRRKEDGTQRRELSEKEIIFHGNRDITSRRKREIDDVSDERKRDQPRMRVDDVYAGKYKEEGLFQRERDRDEWRRAKHLTEEMLSKREREDVRSGMNSIRRAAEEKVWSSHSRVKDEYRGSDREYYRKDLAQLSQQPIRSHRTESVHPRGREDIYAHGDQHRSDGRRARHVRASTRDDHSANASDCFRVHERKPKEYPRNGKENEGGYPNLGPHLGKKQDEGSGIKSDMQNSKGEHEHGTIENLVHGNHRSSSAKLNEEVPSDDEQHHSRRGRSKLERWASHNESDFSRNTKVVASLQVKEPEGKNSSGPSLGTKVPNELSRPAAGDKHNADRKSVDNKQLATVDKLKKRSERFKLPMPGEKEITTRKKVENEPPPPPCQPETCPDIEIKSERPARKRRWTSN